MFRFEFEHDLNNAAASLQRQFDFLNRLPLQDVASKLVEYLVKRIDLGKFKALSPTTKALRAKKGVTDFTPLRATRKLRNAIDARIKFKDEIEIGAYGIPQALFQRRGGVTSQKSMIPGKQVPARDFLDIECKRLEQAACDLLEEYKKVC